VALIYDTSPCFNAVLDNPAEYGFKDAVSFGNLDNVWWDLGHITTAMQKILGKDIAAFIETVSPGMI
jgi:phospholipase/lecithinase/hemolysin